jgi:hypothetical protein
MGNHAMPSKHTLKRTVAAGTIAGCSAVGLGALSTLAAPTANAFCFGKCSHTTTTTTTSGPSSSGSGINVSVSNNNGNTTQSTGAFSGNAFSIPIGLGLAPVNASTVTPITNVSALNGTGNLVTVVAAQTTTIVNTTTTTTTCTGAVGTATCS